MHRSKKKRNIIIFSLVGVLLCMVAGYAAFQTQLKVTGSSTVTSNWDIEITNVTAGTPTGSAENAVAPSYDKLWASMEANLYDKGDAMEYDVTIENKGTLDAKLNDIITNLDNSNNEAVIITFSGYTKGEVLKAKTSKVVHVKIEYNPEYEGGETSSEVEINFDYGQNNNEENNPDSQYLLTYDYSTNGGTSVELTEELIASGSNVDLSNTATKEGWTFVGWNTDKDAQIGLENYQMPASNTTLYAIYSKTLNVTYQQGENITSIGRTTDSCNIYNNQTSCEITLPTITVNNGYNSNGWYDGDNKIGEADSKYNINNDMTLTAQAIDNIAPVLSSITNSSNGNWATSITLSWTINESGSGISKVQYSPNNSTWSDLSSNEWYGLTRNNNRNDTLYIRTIDNAGNISNVASTTMKIETSNPTLSFSTTTTTNKITVVASASAYSGINKYEYSRNGGSSWIIGTSNTYTFTGLTQGKSYNIMVRVTSVSGKQASSSKTVTTSRITNPTFSESGSSPKTVTIRYPSGCGSTYTCTYQKDNGSNIIVTSTTASVQFTASGSLVARVSDGTNSVSSSYTVTILQYTPGQATNVITQLLSKNTNELYRDNHNNIRYYGSRPNNYVSFNNELWRIMGVIDGKIKIIRNESIGDMAWATNNSNNWNNSSLKSYLNGTYYNSIYSTYRNMISSSTYYLGGATSSNYKTLTASGYYNAERDSSQVYSGNPASTTQHIGLMYPSDYGYAAGSSCLSTALYSYDSSCKNSDYLYIGVSEWLQAPYARGRASASSLYSSGYVNAIISVTYAYDVRPVLYLSSNVQITGGDGSQGNAFKLG